MTRNLFDVSSMIYITDGRFDGTGPQKRSKMIHCTNLGPTSVDLIFYAPNVANFGF